MSARRFARDVPRSVQHAVRAALDLVDEKGEVQGGMPALQQALGHDSPSATRTVVAQAEAWGFLRRTGPVGHGARRVFLVEARLKSGACATPGCDREVRGDKRPDRPRSRWCRTCRQIWREDRAWQPRAVEMCVAGSSPAIIARALNRPLWPEDGDNGVVAYLLGEVPALVSADWRAALKEQAPHLFHVEQAGGGGALSRRQRERRQARRRTEATVS